MRDWVEFDQKIGEVFTISSDVVSNHFVDFFEFAGIVLTYLLLLSFQGIRIVFQICYLDRSYLVWSADQKSFSLFHWQQL